MKYEIEMTEQDIKDLRAVRNYFGENDRTIFEHKAYAILDGIVKKLNKPAVSVNEVKVCPICGVPFYYLYNNDYYQQQCDCDLSGQT